MEYYENYLARLEAEGTGPELLEELHQEAIQSLRADPPERALTLTGQMVSALLLVSKRQKPPECEIVDALNNITNLMIDYLQNMGWRLRARKTPYGWRYEFSPG